MESTEPLTKAKLFASHDSGQWTEIGLGVVTVVTETLPATAAAENGLHSSGERTGSAGGGGKRGKAVEAEGRTAARLQMYSLDSSNDLLLSSYVSLDDIYTIQGDAILLWYDEAVGNEIACSFNSKDGCDAIYRQIRAFQQAERLRRVQDERMPSLADKFLVHPRNLATILDAAQTQNKRFGLYVRDDSGYFIKLAQLFHSSQKSGDTEVMQRVAQIVLALLQTPYSSDGKIIAQFVENECIDDCIDIVQYALGRCDTASGFVSFEERRATFHDPCHLPEAMKSRIHVLYSCGFLKDLIPLSLEPADAGAYSLLSTFTLRFTMSMLTELCDSPTLLPQAFEAALEAVRLEDAGVDPASIESSKVAHLFELAAFVGEIAKTVKNAMIGVDMRTDIFLGLWRASLLAFLTGVLECALRYYEPPSDAYPVAQWVVQPPRAVQLVCDTLYSCLVYLPHCVKLLVAQAKVRHHRSLLHLLLRALTVVQSSAEAQSVMDAVQCCGVGVPLTVAMFGDNGHVESDRHEVLRYWIEGNAAEQPPLLHLAAYLVNALTTSTASAPAHVEESEGGSGVGVVGPQLTPVMERQVVFGLRLFTLVLGKMHTALCGTLMEVVTLSNLLPALSGVLAQPSRRLANLQSSVVAFISAVLERREPRLAAVVASGSPPLLHTALELFLQCSHRDNILTSSLAHLLTAVCEGAHREKLNDGHARTTNGSSSIATISPSPFITLLRNEDSMSKTETNAPTPTVPSRSFEALASDVLSEFGERLAVAAPVLHAKLWKVVWETTEEAQEAEANTSSLASSMERPPVMSASDFDADTIDFGFDPAQQQQQQQTLQQHRPSPLEAVTEERLSSLTRSCTTSEDEEDDDDDRGEWRDAFDDYEAEEGKAEEATPTEEEEEEEETITDATAEDVSATDLPGGADDAAAAATVAAVRSDFPLPSPSLTTHSSPHALPITASSAAACPAFSGVVALPESTDSPSGRGSLLEDEENRLPRRLSVKRGRTDSDKMENEEAEDEAEVKRVRAEESAA